jgi:hypothetical protein
MPTPTHTESGDDAGSYDSSSSAGSGHGSDD